MALKKIVLDVLIPLEVSVVDLVENLNSIEGVEAVEIDIRAIERKVETTVITVEGNGFSYDSVKETLEKTGATMQNIDRIAAGRK